MYIRITLVIITRTWLLNHPDKWDKYLEKCWAYSKVWVVFICVNMLYPQKDNLLLNVQQKNILGDSFHALWVDSVQWGIYPARQYCTLPRTHQWFFLLHWNFCEYIKDNMWPCITKPTKSCIAQFCVMARNRWSGSAWIIFRFWYILKEQSFFYIILKFGSIKHIISKVFFCCFSRPIFLRSDGSCDHNTCPIISL